MWLFRSEYYIAISRQKLTVSLKWTWFHDKALACYILSLEGNQGQRKALGGHRPAYLATGLTTSALLQLIPVHTCLQPIPLSRTVTMCMYTVMIIVWICNNSINVNKAFLCNTNSCCSWYQHFPGIGMQCAARGWSQHTTPFLSSSAPSASRTSVKHNVLNVVLCCSDTVTWTSSAPPL